MDAVVSTPAVAVAVAVATAPAFASGPSPEQVRRVVTALGGTRRVARRLGLSQNTVQHWPARGSIPDIHWLALVALAAEGRVRGINVKRLLGLRPSTPLLPEDGGSGGGGEDADGEAHRRPRRRGRPRRRDRQPTIQTADAAAAMADSHAGADGGGVP